jgi:MFS family permease
VSQYGKIGLGGITALTMAVSTFPQVVFAVLAGYMIDEFGIDRWQIGLLVTSTAVAGAFLALPLGRVTDRIGPLPAIRSVLALAVVSLSLVAISPAYVLLAAAALLSGGPQGWCNPATNALIAEGIPSGERGVVTGIKQSGVQVGTFFGGLLLPVIAAAWGWRYAVAAFVAIPLIGLISTAGRGSATRSVTVSEDLGSELPPVIRLVSIYGFLSGFGTSAMLTFLPLFAAEDQGWPDLQAGWLLAGVGLTGVVARVFWGAIAESRLGYGAALQILALLTVCSSLILALAASGIAASWSLIPAALLLGVGGVSWNSVGMLAVMEKAPTHLIGKGTGVVLFGFLLGYGVGAPILGLSVDNLNSYVLGWLLLIVAFLGAAAVARRVRLLDPIVSR